MAALMSELGDVVEFMRWTLCKVFRVASRARYVSIALVVLLVVLLLFALSWTLDQRQVEKMQRMQVELVAASRSGGPLQPQEEILNWEAFEGILASADALPSVVQDMIDTGDAAQIEILGGTYAQRVDEGGRFSRAQIVMPVKGNAAAIRRFVTKSLAKHPSLALQNMQMNRDSASANQIEGQVEWHFFSKLPRDGGGYESGAK